MGRPAAPSQIKRHTEQRRRGRGSPQHPFSVFSLRGRPVRSMRARPEKGPLESRSPAILRTQEKPPEYCRGLFLLRALSIKRYRIHLSSHSACNEATTFFLYNGIPASVWASPRRRRLSSIQKNSCRTASPPVEVLREGGRGRAFFSKSPSSPSQTPPLYPQRLLTLSNPSCWGCRCCEAVPVNGVFVWKEGGGRF